jgi:hypothetical protein
MLLLGFAAARELGLGVLPPKIKDWFVCYFIWIVFVALYGIYLGNPLLNVFMRALDWLTPVILFMALGKSNWQRIFNALLVQQVLGIILAIMFVSQVRFSFRDLAMVTQGYTVASFLYAIPFLLFLWNELSKTGKIIAIIGYICMSLSVLMTMSRSALISSALILVIAIYISLKQQNSLNNLVNKLLMSFTILIVFITIIVWISPNMEESYYYRSFQNTIDRFIDLGGTNSSAVGEFASSSMGTRLVEARVFIEDELKDSYSLILGKGMAGKWNYLREEWTIVEIGFLHVIFVGGLPLLLLLAIFPFSNAIRLFITAKDPFKIAASAMFIYILIFDIQYPMYGFTIFQAMLMGFLFEGKERK